MKKFFLLLCAILLMFGVAGSAGATVLGFDDIAPTSSFEPIPNGYGGFSWDNFYYMNQNYPLSKGFPDTGYKNGTVSGDYSAFNGYGEFASLNINSGVFDFVGAYLTSAWQDGNSVTVEGYLGGPMGILVDAMTVTVNTDIPTWVDFNFVGIDSLVFSSTEKQFVLDDFTYNSSTPVPEPATMLLLGAGLLGMGVVGRKKFFKKA